MSDNDNGRRESPQSQAENLGQKRFHSLLNELREAQARVPNAESTAYEIERRVTAHG